MARSTVVPGSPAASVDESGYYTASRLPAVPAMPGTFQLTDAAWDKIMAQAAASSGEVATAGSGPAVLGGGSFQPNAGDALHAAFVQHNVQQNVQNNITQINVDAQLTQNLVQQKALV